MRKLFTITKTGYSAGIYGNTGEYFTLIYIDNDIQSYIFKGQYGAESRVAEIMKKAGYSERYVYSNYGKLRITQDVRGQTYSEYKLIEELKEKFNIN